MNHVIELLTHFIISFIQSTGYAGVFLLMTAESALIPFPSEVTMPFAGFLAQEGVFNVYAVIFVGALANLFGSIIAYALGYYGEELVVRKLIHKYGKYLLVSMHEYDRSERWFRKYGDAIVFWTRLLPIVRTFISLPAGISKMNFWKFCGFTFVGSLIWSAFLTYIGFALGKNWHSIENVYRKFEYIVVIAVVILVVYFIWHKWQRLHHKTSI